MSVKNRSVYAILGVLSIASSSGYDIKKYCDTVLSGFWNENFGHIYPTLKRMTEDGTIEIVDSHEKDTGGKTDRKIKYAVTEKGKLELEKWLLEEAELQPVRSEFMLKLFFSDSLSEESILLKLTDYKEIHKEKLEKYLQMQGDLEKNAEKISSNRIKFLKATLRSGILSCEAVIRWCDETMEDMVEA